MTKNQPEKKHTHTHFPFRITFIDVFNITKMSNISIGICVLFVSNLGFRLMAN